MISNGIMEDIRTLLTQGKSSREVIQLGYAPGTVYKVQRQLKQQQQYRKGPVQEMEQEQSISEREAPEELSAEDAEFFRCLFEPADDPAQSRDLHAQLDRARDRIEELEKEAGKVQVLQERVHNLEAEAEACIELRRRVQDLERQLKSAGNSETALRQTNAQWQTKFQGERSAREQAERQARDCQELTSQWQQAYQVVNSKLEASTQVIANLRVDLRQLEPLKAWAGHPCSVCHKPMSGSVGRELAAELQKGLAHRACLQKQGGGIGKLLVAGVGLYGLCKLRK